MERLTLEKLVVYSLIIIAFLILLIFFMPSLSKLKIAIFGNQSSEAIVDKSLSEVRILFFDNIVSDYQSCKYSRTSDCYCPLRNTNIPKGFVVEISNNNDKSILRLNKNAALSGGVLNDYSLSSTNPEAGISSVDVSIDNDKLFVENVAFGSPKILDDHSLDFKDFLTTDKVYLEESKLFTNTDLKGSNSIDFSNGVLYKKDEKRTFLLKKFDGMTRCSSLPNIDKAISQFDSLHSVLSKCKLHDNNKCAELNPVIPADYFLKYESGNLNLYYKSEKVKSSEFVISCILNSFNNPSKSVSEKIDNLLFNDFSVVNFYSYSDNSLCVAVK